MRCPTEAGWTIATKNMGASDHGRPTGLPVADYVAISVSDTGIGMTREVAAKAFEPFFSTKEIGKGTGLGLSQVLGFAEQSGGEVRIDTRLGQGTTITLFCRELVRHCPGPPLTIVPHRMTAERRRFW
jgi:signal transduction histidine kinase